MSVDEDFLYRVLSRY